MSKKQSFSEKCYSLLRKVPHGRVTTYKAIAEALGTKAYRVVGNAMHKNPYSPRVPCHRVVCSDSKVGGFALGKRRKIEMLKKEGLQIEKGKVKSFEKRLFEFN
jgi:methylated-DNA-[protein]-cysteine S-methyltransferase